MKTIVVMPGGFHPFHAGHAALYQSAVKAFPGADVFVAATNDTKTRPFPFAIKEKLAKLAGVAPGHFIQVKSPFKAEEITSHYNPDEDVLIFVRSEKDRTEHPKPGGIKKDGTPAYFQPYTGKGMQPFNKHAYIAYLPTVEFGPGITSATEIRNAWPTLNDKRKTAMVMSLYPATQKNPALADNVVKMLDMGMGGEETVAEGLAWSTLDEDMSMEDKMSVFEEFHTKGNLTESVDDDKKDYFVSLFNMSASPIKGKKYIVVPLSLVGNRILPLDSPSIAEFVAQSNDRLTFNTTYGEKTYPSKTMRDLSIFNTFTFSSTGVYDKFRTALSLKFDITLPNISKNKQQGVAEGAQGTSVKGWAAQVRREHGSDVKFTNDKHGGGTVNRVNARNSQGETVGVYNRNTGAATVFEPKQDVAEGEAEALQYATKAHAGQTRSGGDPYITHPMRVADHIRQYKQSHNLDALISAAYLHDTMEDTDTTQEALHDLFGGLVASLVKELTSDPAQIKKLGKATYLAHKMAAMSSYGLVIKLADRLDNVKDITTAKTPEWRAKYAAETNQILNYIEKTRALSSTHQKLIDLIRAKLAEIDNVEQGVTEAFTYPSQIADPEERARIHDLKNLMSTFGNAQGLRRARQLDSKGLLKATPKEKALLYRLTDENGTIKPRTDGNVSESADYLSEK